ncbi:MAG: hypothetical protein V1913_12390 [Fibrobacterota bacterium]
MRVLALMLCLSAVLFADSVILKTGVVVEGDILGKSDAILKVYVAQFQRAIAIERDKIDRVVMSDDTLTFEQIFLKQRDFNPKFRLGPPRERVRPSAPIDTTQPKVDVFENARRENAESTVQASRGLNRLFNAPARWGSCGIGYLQMTNLDAETPEKFREYDFNYRGRGMDLRCLDAQVRRNFSNGIGTLLIDIGYGKRNLESDSFGMARESAMMRYVAVRYVFCANRWLFSPGLSAGAMFVKSGVIRYAARRTDGTSTQDVQVDMEIHDRSLRPLVGLDLNFYDVIAANVSVDLLRFGGGRYCAGLAFLLPFLQ